MKDFTGIAAWPPWANLAWPRWHSISTQLTIAALTGVVLGTATAWLPAWLAVGMIPALLGLWWIMLRPEMGLLLTVAITGGLVNYDQIPYLSLGPVSFHATDLLLLLLLGLAVVRLLVEREFEYVSTALDVPLLLFFGMAVVSVITAVLIYRVSPSLAIREFRIVTYWLGFFAVTQLIRTPKQLKTLVYGLFVLSLLMTAVVLLQTAVPSLPLVRVSSEALVTVGKEFSGVSRVWITGERLIYAMLITAVCLTMMLPSGKKRRIYSVVAAFLFVWLFMSFQRNYWATTAFALGLLALVIPWSARLRGLRWLVLLVTIMGVVLFLPGSPLEPWGAAALDRVLSVQSSSLEQDTSAILRETEVQYAFHQIVKHPLLGVGIGNAYRPWMRRFDFLPWATTDRGLVWYCHNAYVWIWVKMGTPALIFFLWLCFKFLYQGFRQWRQVTNSEWRAIVLGLTLAFAGQMLSNMVAPNFIQNWVLVVFPIMMAVNELVFKWNDLGQIPGEV